MHAKIDFPKKIVFQNMNLAENFHTFYLLSRDNTSMPCTAASYPQKFQKGAGNVSLSSFVEQEARVPRNTDITVKIDNKRMIKGFDMFPDTPHVETVCCLYRK